MLVEDVEEKGSLFIVKVFLHPKVTNAVQSEATTKRFVLRYSNSVCYNFNLQVFKYCKPQSKIPFQIARFFKLPQPSLYTGHFLRRTSVTLRYQSTQEVILHITQLKWHGSWKSSTLAEGYLDKSISNKVATGKRIPGNPA